MTGAEKAVLVLLSVIAAAAVFTVAVSTFIDVRQAAYLDEADYYPLMAGLVLSGLAFLGALIGLLRGRAWAAFLLGALLLIASVPLGLAVLVAALAVPPPGGAGPLLVLGLFFVALGAGIWALLVGSRLRRKALS